MQSSRSAPAERFPHWRIPDLRWNCSRHRRTAQRDAVFRSGRACFVASLFSYELLWDREQ
jgi:hypothetical protein